MVELRYPEADGLLFTEKTRALAIAIEDEEDEPRVIDVMVFHEYRTHGESFAFFRLNAAQAREAAAVLLRLAAELEAPDGPPDQVQRH